jgi:hypothetical protein
MLKANSDVKKILTLTVPNLINEPAIIPAVFIRAKANRDLPTISSRNKLVKPLYFTTLFTPLTLAKQYLSHIINITGWPTFPQLFYI